MKMKTMKQNFKKRGAGLVTTLPSPNKAQKYSIRNTSGKGLGNPPVTMKVNGVAKGRKTIKPQETVEYTVGKKGWVGKPKDVDEDFFIISRYEIENGFCLQSQKRRTK